jgi:hypothetical protein
VGVRARSTALGAALAAAFAFVPAAAADDWLPHPSGATWTYQWTDSVYATSPTIEQVTVKDGADAKAYTLAWTTDGQNSPSGITSTGTVSFQETTGGIENTDWSSNPPPVTFPVLCAQLAGCNNSLASSYYLLIWGGRSPVLQEPLRAGDTWTSTGGAQGDVTSSSIYEGVEKVTVPAFPAPVQAAKVRSDVTQAGARGDPYGSGVRTVWWVYGVGPVKIEYQHAGGANAPVTDAVLQSTTLTPKPAPADANWFPMTKGATLRYQWTNPTHLKTPSIQQFTIDDVVNDVARFSVKSVSGPVRTAGSYIFVSRLDGLTNTAAATKAATTASLPPLGPASAPPSRRRHFFTPFDLLVFGFNPVLDAYPAAGDTWAAKNPSWDFSVFGVTGATRVVGVQQVTVPAGTFKALVVTSTLKQAGFPFGSGTRTAWFAAGKGLVKLVFRHGDGSVSTVELLK